MDVPRSDYQRGRVFPILDYDGIRLPLESESIDAVFSSNVLEHVVHLPEVLAETRRVLRPGGFAVHVMPSPTWRLWTSVSGPLDAATYSATWLMERLRKRSLPARSLAGGIAARFAPTAHGERGTAFSELLTFSSRHWKQVFVANGFEVLAAEPMHLFYTGWSLLGKRLSLTARERLAAHLGSSCWIYKVRPI